MKKYLVFSLAALCLTTAKAQIEVDHLSFKNFKANGFGAFLNFSAPVSEADYVTLEGGFAYFTKDGDEAAQAPVLAGYRYTFNRTGTGLYLEPNAGYNFGATDILVVDEGGRQLYNPDGSEQEVKIKGPAAGLGLGYLLEPGGRVQLNFSLRYEHAFGQTPTNTFSFRISHAFSFSRKQED